MKPFVRLLFVMMFGLACTMPACAQDTLQLAEQEIKAGLLYNFLKYTQWPAAPDAKPDAPTVVCLFKDDPFAVRLQPMVGRTVNQRPIEIRLLADGADPTPCSLIYLAAAKKDAWPKLQTALAGKGVLTVSDFDGFAASGGMIEFTRIDNRIAIKVNTDAVTSAHLIVEDRLLRLASAVHTPAVTP